MRAVLDQLPHESVAYFGDTARAPYGPRPIAQTRELALECLDRLVDHGVKILVIACNTASAAVLHDARERYDVPVVEVIRPAVRRAAAATRSGRVGVISTVGTHQSGAYLDAFAAAPHLDVVEHPLPALRGVRRARCHRRPRARRCRARVPRPAARARRRHPGARLHPLPAAHRRHLATSWATRSPSCPRAEETAKDVYRVLADADLLRPDDLPATRPRLHHHGRPRGVPPTGRPVPRRRLPARTGVHLAAARGVGGPDVRVTVVGCAGSFAGPESPASCYLVAARRRRAAPGTSCSTSAAVPSARCSAHLSPDDLDAVVLSHLHPDHCVDLCGLYVTRRYRPGGPLPARLPVHGPSGTAERVAAMYHGLEAGGMEAEFDVRDRRRCRAAHRGPVHRDPVRREPPGRGLRLPGRGRTVRCWPSPVTPTTATTWTPLLRGADLALCDSAFVDGRDTVPGIHLSGSRAAAAAMRAGGVRPARAHPPARLERPARRAAPRRPRSGRARSSWPPPTPCYDL